MQKLDVKAVLRTKWVGETSRAEIVRRFSSPLTNVNEQSRKSEQNQQIEELQALLAADPREIENLGAAIGPISHSLLTNLCAHLSTLLQQGKLPGTPNPTLHQQHQQESVQESLAVAQLIFLLTRTYQVTEKNVKELLSLLEVQIASQIQTFAPVFAPVNTERINDATAYLITLSLCNSLALWRQLYSEKGVLQQNALVRNDVMLEALTQWVKKTRGDLSSDGARSKIDKSGALPILSVALAIFSRPSNEDQALDCLVEACRLKGMKYLTKRIPNATLLSIPRWMLSETTFLILDYVLSNMLPSVKHLADMDVDSYRDFVARTPDAVLVENFRTGKDEPAKRIAYKKPTFSSYMGHFLIALADSAADLPLEYINGTEDDPGSIWHFLWVCMVNHFRQIFDTHKQQGHWEAYTTKLCGLFLSALESLTRNETVARQVFCTLDCQVDCSELFWSSLVSRCKDSIGYRQNESYTTDGFVPKGNVPKRLSQQYVAKQQNLFAKSVLSLMEQISYRLPQPQLTVGRIIAADDVLAMLSYPDIAQPVAGAILSLLASQVNNSEAHRQIWGKVIELQLLRTKGSLGLVSEQHDIRWAFTLECRGGAYAITKGFLKLVLACLSYPHETTALPFVQFVAEEVFCGLSARAAVQTNELYEVGALAASVLHQALSNNAWVNGEIPFATIMATASSPNNVAERNRSCTFAGDKRRMRQIYCRKDRLPQEMPTTPTFFLGAAKSASTSKCFYVHSVDYRKRRVFGKRVRAFVL